MPAAAQAKLTVGIAENNPGMFADPLFDAAQGQARALVVSWNVATAGDDEINRVIDYLAAAQAAGVDAAGDLRARARRRDDLQPAQEPQEGAVQAADGKQYEAACAPSRLFPKVRNVVAWNEINHFTQPTYKTEGRREVHDDRAQGLQGRDRGRRPTSSTRPTTRAKSPTFRSTTR